MSSALSVALLALGLFVHATLAQCNALAVAPESPKQACRRSYDPIELPGYPFRVVNHIYSAWALAESDTSCTSYRGITQDTNRNAAVEWSNVAQLRSTPTSDSICKGYANVAVAKNIDTRVRDVASVPVTTQWTRVNRTDYKGNFCLDLITSPYAGDNNSTNTQELMIWFKWTPDQLPLGNQSPPRGTVQLFGRSFTIWEGVNGNNNVTVRSLLPDTQYDGEFAGDVKDALDVFIRRGYLRETDFITAATIGTELWSGDFVLNSTTSIQIKREGDGDTSCAPATRDPTNSGTALQSDDSNTGASLRPSGLVCVGVGLAVWTTFVIPTML